MSCLRDDLDGRSELQYSTKLLTMSSVSWWMLLGSKHAPWRACPDKVLNLESSCCNKESPSSNYTVHLKYSLLFFAGTFFLFIARHLLGIQISVHAIFAILSAMAKTLSNSDSLFRSGSCNSIFHTVHQMICLHDIHCWALQLSVETTHISKKKLYYLKTNYKCTGTNSLFIHKLL